ncbi:MAG: site-specific integrase [Bacteroidota bacterium]
MITIRYKALLNGQYSLYLDIYNQGQRQRKFLNLRSSKDYSTNRFIVKEDIDAINLARQAAKEFSDGNTSICKKSLKNKKRHFIEFIVERTSSEMKLRSTEQSLIKHIRLYTAKNDIPFSILTRQWIEGFEKYLESGLAKNTVNSLVYTMKCLLNDAMKSNLIKQNPLMEFRFRHHESIPKYLTPEEILDITNTATEFNPQIRLAFLLSLYTGLTWDQILNLKWEQIKKSDPSKKKTWTISVNGFSNHATYCNILSNKAISILSIVASSEGIRTSKGKYRDESNINRKAINLTCQSGNVFKSLPNKSNCNIHLRLWSALAGLKKNLCFSMARNTFAIIQLNKGADKKSVKQLLNTKSDRIIMKFTKLQNSNTHDTSSI